MDQYYVDKQFAEEKTAEATGEILINESEFNAAVKKTMDDIFDDPKIDGMTRLTITLSGMTFAEKMRKYLFKNESEVE